MLKLLSKAWAQILNTQLSEQFKLQYFFLNHDNPKKVRNSKNESKQLFRNKKVWIERFGAPCTVGCAVGKKNSLTFQIEIFFGAFSRNY